MISFPFKDSFDSYDDSEEMLLGATNNLVSFPLLSSAT
jgi:hypothetical protein